MYSTARLQVVRNGTKIMGDTAVTVKNYEQSKKHLIRRMSKGDYLVVDIVKEDGRTVVATDILRKITNTGNKESKQRN